MSLNGIDPTGPIYTLSKFSGEANRKRGKKAMPMSVEKIDYEEGISENTKRAIRDYLATFYPGTQLRAVKFLSKRKGKDVAMVYIINELGEMFLLFLGGSLMGMPYLIFMSPVVHTENVVIGSYIAMKNVMVKSSRKVRHELKKVWKDMKKTGVWLTSDLRKRKVLEDLLK